MKFVFVTSIVETIIAINPDNISHIDNVVSKDGKAIIGQSMIILKTQMFIKVRGNPKDVAFDLMDQLKDTHDWSARQ